MAGQKYLYRIDQTVADIKDIVSTRTNAYFIGLPESGVKRTVSESFSHLLDQSTFSIIDLSLATSDLVTYTQPNFDIQQPGKANYILIENLPIYTPSGVDTFVLLEKLRDRYPKNTYYIYHFNTNPQWYGISESPRRLNYFSTASSSEFPQLVDHFLKRFSIPSITQSELDILYKVTGGHPYLVKKAFELSLNLHDHGSLRQGLQSVANSIVNQLHISEIIRLKDISSQDQEFINHFQNLGLIDSSPALKDSVLGQAIVNFQTQLKLNINYSDKSISLGDHSLESYFSSYELSIIFALSQYRFLEREKVIELCWGKLAPTVSDAAVDKMISRLRQKLIGLGLPKDIISTRRGRGFDLNL